MTKKAEPTPLRESGPSDPRAGAGPPASPGTEELVHRGVRWRRSASGRVMWFNEGFRRWVLWSAGSDSPPPPPGWASSVPGTQSHEQEGAGQNGASARPGLLRYVPTDAMARRPPLRSPYRIVPMVIAVLIVAAAIYQATQPAAKATRQDIAAAEALKGQCLARIGGSAQLPHFSATPVSCTGPAATVRVANVVVPGKPGSCPKASLLARVLDPGIAGEPVECLVPVAGH